MAVFVQRKVWIEKLDNSCRNHPFQREYLSYLCQSQILDVGYGLEDWITMAMPVDEHIEPCTNLYLELLGRISPLTTYAVSGVVLILGIWRRFRQGLIH